MTTHATTGLPKHGKCGHFQEHTEVKLQHYLYRTDNESLFNIGFFFKFQLSAVGHTTGQCRSLWKITFTPTPC